MYRWDTNKCKIIVRGHILVSRAKLSELRLGFCRALGVSAVNRSNWEDVGVSKYKRGDILIDLGHFSTREVLLDWLFDYCQSFRLTGIIQGRITFVSCWSGGRILLRNLYFNNEICLIFIQVIKKWKSEKLKVSSL